MQNKKAKTNTETWNPGATSPPLEKIKNKEHS